MFPQKIGLILMSAMQRNYFNLVLKCLDLNIICCTVQPCKHPLFSSQAHASATSTRNDCHAGIHVSYNNISSKTLLSEDIQARQNWRGRRGSCTLAFCWEGRGRGASSIKNIIQNIEGRALVITKLTVTL